MTQEEIADLLAPMEHEGENSADRIQKDRAEKEEKLAALSRLSKKDARIFSKDSSQVRVEAGRGQITDEEFLLLKKGSIVPLEKRIEQPLELYLDNQLIARGKIVRMSNKIAFKVIEVIPVTQLPDKSA